MSRACGWHTPFTNSDPSLPGVELCRSLSEEKLIEYEEEEGDREVTVVRSEGEETESEGEGEMGKQLEEMRTLQNHHPAAVGSGVRNQHNGGTGDQRNGEMVDAVNDIQQRLQNGTGSQEQSGENGTKTQNEANAGVKAATASGTVTERSPGLSTWEGPSPSPSPLSPDSLAGTLNTTMSLSFSEYGISHDCHMAMQGTLRVFWQK